MKTKAFHVELKADHNKREIEGYAAMFNLKDHGDDVIVKGAFSRSIDRDFAPPGSGRNNRVKVLYQHLKHEPIGRPLELAEDSKGLHFRAKLTKGVARADETLALVADDVIDQMSFGYDTIESEMGDWEEAGDTRRVRFLKELGIWEISPVTWGMNDQTQVAMAKGIDPLVEKLKDGSLDEGELKELMGLLAKQETALAELRATIEGSIQEQKGCGHTGRPSGGFERLEKYLESLNQWTKGRKE